MATYHFYKAGYALPFDFHGQAVLSQNINIPAIIASGVANVSPLAVAGTRTALPSTGFAASDVLQLWRVPAGLMITCVGVRVTTAEGAACTADIGNASATQTHLLAADPDGYMGTCDLNSPVTQITLHDDAQLGKDVNEGVVFVTNGTIDITFNSADTNAAIFDVFALGAKVF